MQEGQGFSVVDVYRIDMELLKDGDFVMVLLYVKGFCYI